MPTPTTATLSKGFLPPTPKSVMDARIAKKKLKSQISKKLSGNTKKMNVIKKQKLSQNKYILFVE